VRSANNAPPLRRLDGVVLLDKPEGLSSNRALQVARRLLRAEKGGHTGSLDPLATGLLPLCFGEATKLAGELLGSDKAYEAEVTLGITTDTDDAHGQILRQRPIPVITSSTLQSVLAQFTGTFLQRAPIYSALKQGGQPLYARARRGEIVQAPEREVTIHRLELLEQRLPQLRLQVVCGSGTYIRSLARDVGELLGCGAHISALRRLWVTPFRNPSMISLEDIRHWAEQADLDSMPPWLLPLERGLAHFPKMILNHEQAQRFYHGQCFTIPQRFTTSKVAVFDRTGKALGLARIDENGQLCSQRRFNH